MPPPSKQKRKSKEQPRTTDGKYNIKKTCNNSWDSLMLEVSYNNNKEKCQNSSKTSCCACRVIFLKLDFLAQKGAIAEIIKKAGYKCIFYPKFHCELNFIERY